MDEQKPKINIDVKKTVEVGKKFFVNPWVIAILILLFASIITANLRLSSYDLPITNQWASGAVYNYEKQQISAQILKESPNLPQDVIDKEAANRIAQLPADQVKQMVAQVSQQYKDELRNSNGETYLPDIDTWMWVHYANNFIKYGMTGDKKINGIEYDTLRNGRIGREEGFRLHGWVLFVEYKILHAFTGMSLMKSVWYFTTIFVILSIIPIYILTKKVAGTWAAFLATMIMSISMPLLSRTSGGFADTDVYNVLCPAFTLWFLIEAIYTKKTWTRIFWSALGGLSVLVYNMAWGGWFYVFDFILAALGIYGVYTLIFKKFTEFKDNLVIGLVFFFSFLIPTWIIRGFNSTIWFIHGPFNIIQMENVAQGTIWPNVLTTVAEFNKQTFSALITSFGGKFFFLIAIIGIIYCLWKEKRLAILLAIWFIGASYAYTKGARFSILLVPAFVIAFALGAVCIYYWTMKLFKAINLDKWYAKGTIIVGLSLLFIVPGFFTASKLAFEDTPSVNDAWWDTLISIKNDCTDGILTSWWDFGHWFYTISERRVTFDGGDQGHRIYWVGKILTTGDEEEAIKILRMLNCRQEGPYIELINKGLTEKQAVDNVLLQLKQNYDFCENISPLPEYFIASEDMVGKSGVWAHFGTWDFDKAILWQRVRAGNITGVDIHTQDDIMNTDADKWISAWPSYAGQLSCAEKNQTITCTNGLVINVNLTVNSDRVKYISYVLNNTFIKKELNPNGEFSVLLTIRNGVVLSDNALADSMFTRTFFFDGIGLRHFRPFLQKQNMFGTEIYVYKVDLNQTKNNISNEQSNKTV